MPIKGQLMTVEITTELIVGAITVLSASFGGGMALGDARYVKSKTYTKDAEADAEAHKNLAIDIAKHKESIASHTAQMAAFQATVDTINSNLARISADVAQISGYILGSERRQ